jgi:hypothetical protein
MHRVAEEQPGRRDMTETLTLTAVYEPVEGGWIQARIEELPAVITVAPSAADAGVYLLDALREYLLSLASQLPDGGTAAPAISPAAQREPLTLELSTAAPRLAQQNP